MRRKFKSFVSIVLFCILLVSCNQSKTDPNHSISFIPASSSQPKSSALKADSAYSPIAIGNEVIACTTEGKVFRIGSYVIYGDGLQIWSKKIEVKGLSNIMSVFAQYDSYYAIDSSGNLWAWGDNRHGQLGIKNADSVKNPTKVDEVKYAKKISFFGNQTFIITQDDCVMTCGSDTGETPQFIDSSIFNNIKDMNWNLVLKNDGSLHILSFDRSNGNYVYYLSDTPLNSDIVSIYNYNSITKYARAEDGTVYYLTSSEDRPFDYSYIEKTELFPNVAEMSFTGSVLYSSESGLVSTLGERVSNDLCENTIFIAEPNTFNNEFYEAIGLNDDGDIFKFSIDLSSFSKIDIIENVGPIRELYKKQNIGSDGTASIVDLRDLWAQ